MECCCGAITGSAGDLHGGAATDISGCKDPWHTGLQLAVCLDEPDIVQFYGVFHELVVGHQTYEYEDAVSYEFFLFFRFRICTYDFDNLVVFANDVDFQRELKSGQHFTVLLEQLVTSDGRVTHPGRLLAGELKLAKRTVTVIGFRPWAGAAQFYTPQGESVVKSFLRTPMDASHITSRFGMREHPILGYSAMHTGVDFAAPTGTPILAAGAGKVVTAGYTGGYGLFVQLSHTADIGTAYGHMSRLGPGIKPGVSVRQGQVIGFVGSTGMSTGPHLHYEFRRGGKPVNPLAQKFAMRNALSGKDLTNFQVLVRQYRTQLKSAPQVPQVAKKDSAKSNL